MHDGAAKILGFYIYKTKQLPHDPQEKSSIAPAAGYITHYKIYSNITAIIRRRSPNPTLQNSVTPGSGPLAFTCSIKGNRFCSNARKNWQDPGGEQQWNYFHQLPHRNMVLRCRVISPVPPGTKGEQKRYITCNPIIKLSHT